ncbi:MAG: hypothetical protein WC787_00635 [Patescibacteria group bacterium]|jgi:hypothetical protein
MLSTSQDADDDIMQTEEEDLGALGMSVKEADALDSDAEDVEDEEDDDVEKPVVASPVVDDEEPLDGLAALEKMEKELDEPEIDVGDEEEV